MTVRSSRRSLAAVFARPSGEVLDMPDACAAADNGMLVAASANDFIAQPEGTLLLRLPGRSPLQFDGAAARSLPAPGGDPIDAVAAALPLGYTRTLLPAYRTRADAEPLPLYGYAAVAWAEDGFRVAATRTDELDSWSAETHAPDAIDRAIARRSLEFPGNSLMVQLRRCATEYGCYTAQNVFLRQGEAALPVSPACNARCIGCISEQDPQARVKSAQERVRALPRVDEIAAVAVAHLDGVDRALVSFGQGCEGEPLLAAPLIEQAIQAIRSRTAAGTIHCNTNASLPRALARLLTAGLQSIRVSLNSARPETYASYYRPRGYDFSDVRESLRVAARAGAALSLNLLTHPGITDDRSEMAALAALLREYPVSLLQTRTLNVDPEIYFAAVGRPREAPLGMRRWLEWLKAEFPHLRVGNFTRGFG
jgi:pyruvate-formate lyase-activating enzyme